MAGEKNFENKIKKWLEAHHCFYVKFFANRMTKKGVPDILASVGGHFVGIEVKAQNGHPSELQFQKVRAIRESGGFAFIVYPSGWEQLQRILLALMRDEFNREEREVIK